jgi:hypothetical protein
MFEADSFDKVYQSVTGPVPLDAWLVPGKKTV